MAASSPEPRQEPGQPAARSPNAFGGSPALLCEVLGRT